MASIEAASVPAEVEESAASEIVQLVAKKPPRRSVRQSNQKISTRHLSRFHQLFWDTDDRYSTESGIKTRKRRKATEVVHVGRFKVERVYDSPHIYTIDDFLTESELQHLEMISKSCRFSKSFCDTDDNKVVLDENHRTSTFVSIPKQHDAKITAIERKASDLLLLSATQLEGLQLVKYCRGEFFGVHHDLGILQESDGTVEMPPKQSFIKRRLATIFVYLNTLPSKKSGGATYFPACQDLRVAPKRGKAVLFCNITKEGLADEKTIHAGEAVLTAKCIKYGLNIWACEE